MSTLICASCASRVERPLPASAGFSGSPVSPCCGAGLVSVAEPYRPGAEPVGPDPTEASPPAADVAWAYGPCPNCGVVGVDVACSACATFGAHDGPCRHGDLVVPPPDAPAVVPPLSGPELVLESILRQLAGGGRSPVPVRAVTEELELAGLTVAPLRDVGAEAERIRLLAGLVESIAQSVGLPGLVVDLNAAGLGGLEDALREVEDRVWAVRAGRS